MTGERLDRDVGVETVVVQRDGGQADAVDGDTLADLVIRPGQSIRTHGQADVAAPLLQGADRALRT